MQNNKLFEKILAIQVKIDIAKYNNKLNVKGIKLTIVKFQRCRNANGCTMRVNAENALPM